METLNKRCGIFRLFFTAVILVLGMGQFTIGQEKIYHMKWSQPPIEIDPISKTPLYCGWDEPSLRTVSTASAPGIWKIMADDFRCIDLIPVTSVHWWGSYSGWSQETPPDNKPSAWHIAFWDNVPANANITFSRPGRLLWQVEVSADRVLQERVGFDLFPEKPFDTCFQYYVKLNPEEYFWQNQFVDVAETDPNQRIFWISISAVYTSSLANPWGWKTRPQGWMDSAVKLELNVGDIQTGFVVDSTTVKSITNSAICSSPQGYDAAFELDTDPNYIKWEQLYTGIRNWQHYEDEESMALVDPTGVIKIRRLVADDWKCRGRTPITSIIWWGSYIGYRYQACQCESNSGGPKQIKPDYFLLSIWTDVPGLDPNNSQNFSHPGQKVWEYKAYEYDEVLVGYDKHPEAMLADDADTNELSMGYEPVFRYSVQIPQESWFCQDSQTEVYWLSIIAVYKDTQTISFPWGWTNHEGAPWNSTADKNSDAVAGKPILDAAGASTTWDWQELYDQLNMSEDMSFVLITSGDCNGVSPVTCRPVCITSCPPVETTCPAVVTKCPIEDTQCPQEATKCPPVQTQCPATSTQCPLAETRCPGGVTYCPLVQTRCPAESTQCPVEQTRCPSVDTQCPTRDTYCPSVSTRCPPVATQCKDTSCPAVETKCPPASTRCPPASTYCPPSQTQCPAEDTQCPTSTTKCPPQNTRCPVEDTKCPEENTKCPASDTRCPTESTKCPPMQTECPAENTQCPTSTTKCPPMNTRCPPEETKCPEENTKCPASDTECPMESTKCPTVQTKCPPAETKCPTQGTYCPVASTKCPIEQTQCPVVQTECPSQSTQCPVIQTQCPSQSTQCPSVQTQCPPLETKCPAVVSRCICITIYPACPLRDSTVGLWNSLAAAFCPAIEVECPSIVPEKQSSRAD